MANGGFLIYRSMILSLFRVILNDIQDIRFEFNVNFPLGSTGNGVLHISRIVFSVMISKKCCKRLHELAIPPTWPPDQEYLHASWELARVLSKNEGRKRKPPL